MIRSLSRMSGLRTGPIELSIISKLTEQLTPIHLEVVNESFKHNVPEGAETHFKGETTTKQQLPS